jgi:hypothetical protein
VGLHSCAPEPNDLIFEEWWKKLYMTTSALSRKGLNSLINLGAWILWNYRNWCVFDGAAPKMVESLILFGNERRIWMMAGARGLSHLMALFEDLRPSIFMVVLKISKRCEGKSNLGWMV